MRIFYKICLFFFILTLSLFNGVEAIDLPNLSDSDKIYQCTITNEDGECFFAVPVNTYDGGLDNELYSYSNINIQQHFWCSNNQRINHKINYISLLFSTEIMPNAP